MADVIKPFYRVSEREEAPACPVRMLRLMAAHFSLAGIALLVGAVVLIGYLYILHFERVEVDWAALRIERAGKIYQQDVQIQLLVVVGLALASVIQFQAARAVRRREQGTRWIGGLAALMLLAGFPAAWIVWDMQITLIPPAAFRVLAGLLVLQSLLALGYALNLALGRARRAFTTPAAARVPLRRLGTVGIILLLLAVLALFVTLGVFTDWLYEIPVSRPDPGELLYATSFDALNDEWDLYPGRDSAQIVAAETLPVESAALDGRVLVVEYGAPDTNSAVFSSLNRKFGDMDLRVTAQPVAGPMDNQYGVVFRYRDESNYYGFFLSSNGYYYVAKVKNGQLDYISTWGLSDVIRPGYAPNEIRVVAQGDRFRFFVNGQPMPLCLRGDNSFSMWNELAGPNFCYTGDLAYVFRDGDFKQGRVALASGASLDRSEAVVVAFDDLVMVGPDPGAISESQPGEYLYTTSFDVSDRWNTGVMDQWELYDGTDSAQLVPSRDLNLIRASDHPLPTTERVLQLTYGSARPHTIIQSALRREFDDFDLRVTAWWVSGPDDGQYGVIFRQVDAANYYVFLIRRDGMYKLDKVTDGVPETLSEWGVTGAIHRDDRPNEIRVVARGATFAFYINGEPMLLCLKGDNAISQWEPERPGVCRTADATAIVQDSAFARGRIALAAGAVLDTSRPVVVVFDDLMVARPDKIANLEE